jgi:hypothetical protein
MGCLARAVVSSRSPSTSKKDYVIINPDEKLKTGCVPSNGEARWALAIFKMETYFTTGRVILKNGDKTKAHVQD